MQYFPRDRPRRPGGTGADVLFVWGDSVIEPGSRVPMTGAEGLPEPGRRHRARRSRAYGATCSSSHRAAGWDADQAVAALYREHYRSLARIAALLLDDSELAEEITQDAFVSLFRAWGRLRDGGEALRYLRRAVISLARSQAAASPDRLGLPPGLAVGQGPARRGQPSWTRFAAFPPTSARHWYSGTTRAGPIRRSRSRWE